MGTQPVNGQKMLFILFPHLYLNICCYTFVYAAQI